MTPNIYKFNIRNDYVAKAATAIEDFVHNGDKVRIALSGGSSPGIVYKKLALSQNIDWSKVELYQVDERYVPENSENSNAGMIREALPHAEFHGFDSGKPIKRALESYEKMLRKLSPPLFDLVILGLGEDGHTASLFPHGPELEVLNHLTVHSISPDGIKDRLSLTFPAIMSTQKIIFLIRGAHKKSIVARLLESDDSEYDLPAKIALEHPDVSIYYDYSS